MSFAEKCNVIFSRSTAYYHTKEYSEIMSITIEIKGPPCQSTKITRNGKKYNGKQNYLCTQCGRLFASDHEMTYRGCLSWVVEPVKIMLVRNISTVLKMSITTVLPVLTSSTYRIQPKRTRYDGLETDEFWTYVGEKKNKVWLITGKSWHRTEGSLGGVNELYRRGTR